MSATLIQEPIKVGNSLEHLGWSKEQLLEVVYAAVGGRNSQTDNDPPGAGGYMAYREGTRRLREIGTQNLGWERDDSGQISCVYDPVRKIRIVYCSTDGGTGTQERLPQNRSEKGAASERCVSGNQMHFDYHDNVISLSGTANGPVVTWYLCVFSDGDTVRAEISLPTSIENGYFRDFSTRILLVSENENPIVDPTSETELDIDVTRRIS